MDFLRYQKEAERLAIQAGKILQEYKNKAIIKKNKSNLLDITTNADLASEQFLVAEIHKLFTDHSILSEELGEDNRSSDFTWIIDPLDGTKEYIRGLPLYNVSIALEYKGEIVVGVVFRPETNELFSTSKRTGAFLNGKRIFVSGQNDITQSFVWMHLPNFGTKEWHFMENLSNQAYRIRTTSEDVATLCWLARGGLEAWILALPMGWWDVAPGLLMVEEAGGEITDFYGDKIRNRDISKGIVASNGKIHQGLLKYLR